MATLSGRRKRSSHVARKAAATLGALLITAGSLLGVAHADEQRGVEATDSARLGPLDVGGSVVGEHSAEQDQPTLSDYDTQSEEESSVDASYTNGSGEGDEGLLLEEEQRGVAPFAIDPNPGARYLHWTVKQGNDLLGGASFVLQGPNGTQYLVEDCVESPCTGYDRDPDPGSFQVVSGQGGFVSIAASSWWRATPNAAPPEKRFTSSNTQSGFVGTGTNGDLNFGSFAVADAPDQDFTPSCAAGVIYGITEGTGQLRQVDASGNLPTTPSNLGLVAGSGLNMNGLGIGAGGESVYAYNRYTTNRKSVEIWKYDTTNGTWSNTLARETLNFYPIGGAVCQCTGDFFFGGFADSNSGNPFYLWKYSPTTNKITQVGRIATPGGSSVTAQNNGDLAFDSSGNLYVIRSSGTTQSPQVQVFSVKATDLAAAVAANNPQTSIPASEGQAHTMTGMIASVNGVAFDSTGYAYVANNNAVQRFNMPSWTGGTNVVTNGLGTSTDLASCSGPPAIALRKNIVGRQDPGDQFVLSLDDATHPENITGIGSATTSGNDLGVQDQQAGPYVTMRGRTIRFTETSSPGQALSEYKTTWECWGSNRTPLDPPGGADHEFPLSSGEGTTGEITIPTEGEALQYNQVICQFKNDPLGSVTWQKTDAPEDPADAVPLGPSKWKVTPTDPSGTPFDVNDCVEVVADNCTGRDKDPAKGKFLVEGLAVGKYTLQEIEAPSGYVLDPKEYPFEVSAAQKAITLDPKTNKRQPTLTLMKKTCGVPDLENAENDVGCDLENPDWVPASGWQLKATGSNATHGNPDPDGWATTDANGSAGTWQLQIADTETPGSAVIQEDAEDKVPPWRLQEIECVSDGGSDDQVFRGDQIGSNLNATLDGITAGENWTCTFKNRLERRPPPGNVAWEKVGEAGELLGGSEWEIYGPTNRGEDPEAELHSIVDCVAETEEGCYPEGYDPASGAPPSFVDIDPGEGKFKVTGLPCGTYTLTETKAPPFFAKLQDPIPFVINGTCPESEGVYPDTDLKKIENKIARPELPLTGGMSAFTYFVVGGSLIGLAAVVGTLARRKRLNS